MRRQPRLFLRARQEPPRPDRDPPPTGWIMVDGALMAFWLPDGIKPADVRVRVLPKGN